MREFSDNLLDPAPHENVRHEAPLRHLGPITALSNLSVLAAHGLRRVFPFLPHSKVTSHVIAAGFVWAGFALGKQEHAICHYVGEHLHGVISGPFETVFPWAADVVKEAGLCRYIEFLAGAARLIRRE